MKLPELYLIYFSVPPCSTTECQNGGKVVQDTTGTGGCACDCIDGYTGDLCQSKPFRFPYHKMLCSDSQIDASASMVLLVLVVKVFISISSSVH